MSSEISGLLASEASLIPNISLTIYDVERRSGSGSPERRRRQAGIPSTTASPRIARACLRWGSHVTTRSNAFRLHTRIELLSKDLQTPPDQFDPARDRVIGRYWGSARIERALETDHPDMPDYARNPERLPPIEQFYKFFVRAVSTSHAP